MQWLLKDAFSLNRFSGFPLQVHQFYYCKNRVFPPGYTVIQREKRLEVCLRLESGAALCRDRINDIPMNIAFPNIMLKYPGDKVQLEGEKPRDVIGFSYPQSAIPILAGWKLLPEKRYWELFISSELEQKIAELRKLFSIYTTLPDAGDRLDAAAFQILREAIFCRWGIQVLSTPENRIKKAALYFQHHYDQLFNMDEVAGKFGFSHSEFFRVWKQYFGIPPRQYLENLKIREGAVRLIQSNQTIAETVKEVGFSGVSAFHRKFREYFGMTPREFRKRPECWKQKLPDFTLREEIPV